MSKICTSIEQSKKLIELGIDINSADMCYLITKNNEPFLMPFKIKDSIDIPAWSLSALIKLMPDEISIDNESYYLYFNKKGVEFRGPITWDGQKSKSFKMDNILDAAFEMICWLKEQRI